MVTGGQLTLLIASILLFLGGAALSLARSWSERAGLRAAGRACPWLGIAVSLIVLVWHAVRRPTGNFLPLEDNFEALLWMAILLAGFVAYMQATRPVSGLDWFLLPLVAMLLALAAVFGTASHREYVNTAVSWVHRATAFGGTIAFVVAGAAGAMYLLATRRLRHKGRRPGPPLANLERVEHLTFTSVTLGFALMTIGLVSGLIWQLRIGHSGQLTRLGPHWWATPKVLLATAAWIVYGIVLHARITPVLRGRKVAILSLVGCVLVVATLIALNIMPVTGNGASGGGMR